MKQLINPAVIVSVLVGIGLGPASATTMVNGSGLGRPATVIDFSGLDGSSLITAPISGVTFTGFYSTNQFPSGRFSPSEPPAAVNFAPPSGAPNPTVTMVFATPQSDVAFFFVTSGGVQETITSSLSGIAVEQISGVSNSQTGGFYGFTGSRFDTITITSSDQNPAVLVDNLQIGDLSTSVPEPASGALLLAGLAGVAILNGRRRG